MRVGAGGLTEYYASLSDEALAEIDPAELTEVARECYLREVQSRGVTAEPPAPADTAELEAELEIEPDWVEHAACPCSYIAYPGSDNAPAAERARDALLAAGIPCQLAVVPPDPANENSPRFDEYRVLVPDALNLRAISVLDKEIFNADLEEDWRTHFAALTDRQLAALNPEMICAGLLDRVERMTRVYNEEVARRN